MSNDARTSRFGPRPVLSGDALDRAIRMYGEGKQIRQIAEEFGIDKSNVSRSFKRAGVAVRRRGKGNGGEYVKVSDADRALVIRYVYGITLDDYARMHATQGGKCAICGADIPKRWSKGVNIDHDHKTGRVRGLLCQHCNHGLGFFRDSPELLHRAASYLSA